MFAENVLCARLYGVGLGEATTVSAPVPGDAHARLRERLRNLGVLSCRVYSVHQQFSMYFLSFRASGYQVGGTHSHQYRVSKGQCVGQGEKMRTSEEASGVRKRPLPHPHSEESGRASQGREHDLDQE